MGAREEGPGGEGEGACADLMLEIIRINSGAFKDTCGVVLHTPAVALDDEQVAYMVLAIITAISTLKKQDEDLILKALAKELLLRVDK